MCIRDRRNDGPAAANMLIYPFHAPKDDVMAYDVQGEERIAVDIDGDYDFTILGPAGFRIDAAGSAPAGGSGSSSASSSLFGSSHL